MTVCSRKVRVESDIDDGTYTTVDKGQVADVLKQCRVPEEEWDANIEEMQKFLRTRIRDSKRIFAFYAAAGEGASSTTMDSGEFWRFVKDCQFCKDRKVLPSVRIDLIFQRCNQVRAHAACICSGRCARACGAVG